MKNMDHRCPMCGTSGKVWHKQPEVFVCPSCSSYYSRYGMVLETEVAPHEEGSGQSMEDQAEQWN